MSHRVWLHQLTLAADNRILALDLPGHGNAADTVFSYAACCADILYLIERLQLHQVVIVGWSMGAQIAVRVCQMLQGRIAGLVLVGGTPCFCSSGDYRHGLPPAHVRAMELRIKKDYLRTAREFFASMFSVNEAAKLDLELLTANFAGKLPSQQNALDSLKALAACDLRVVLPTITTPVLLIHGVDDVICPSSAGEYMAACMPVSRIRLLPSLGHAPFLTDPGGFNEMISDFVKDLHG